MFWTNATVRTRIQTNSRLSLILSAAIIGSLANTPAMAQELEISVTIPQLKVAEYHRPYVAMWIDQPAGGEVTNLAVWYDTELKDREGEKWLKDIRQWWRYSGRSQTMPLDGVTGATRAPGTHTLTFRNGEPPLNELAPGDYRLRVEASREVGGRELITVPFSWPPEKATVLEDQGESELGDVSLRLSP